MSGENSLQVIPQLTAEQVELVKRNFAKEATDDELKIFMHQCNRTGLDPISRQIYFQKYKNKDGKSNITIITGIDGYRIIATRTGCYAGSDDAVFDNEQEPNKATVTVYRLVQGIRCAFTATARWNEYYPGDTKGHQWRKMPCVMLAKCAEALALRKAFPNELSGVYTKEEMDQAHATLVVDVPQGDNKQEGAKQEQAAKTWGLYDGSAIAQKALYDHLTKMKVDVDLHMPIHVSMINKDKSQLNAVVKQVTDELVFGQKEMQQ